MTSIVLTHYSPASVDSGAALRNRQMIWALAQLGPVDVVSVGLDVSRGPVNGVREWVSFDQHALAACRPMTEGAVLRMWPFRLGVHPEVRGYRHRRVIEWLRDRCENWKYDVAVIEELSLAAYLDTLRSVARCVVFDAHNVEGMLETEMRGLRSRSGCSVRERCRRWLLRCRLAREEGRAARRANVVWACSARDAATFSAIYRVANEVVVVPNAIDVESRQAAAGPVEGDDWLRAPLIMLYVGTYSYYANESAALMLADEVLPAVRRLGWDARVILAGRNPTAAMELTGRRDPTVTVTGAVEDVSTYLRKPCVVTVPLRAGGGTRLKILEAFAASRPVVSTRKGAEGLDVSHGQELLLEDDADGLARSVVEVWKNAQLRLRLTAGALRLVRSKYSWAAAAQAVTKSLVQSGLVSNRN